MYSLRPYQEELIEEIFAEWLSGNRRVMAQLATGAGKTVIFSHIARAFLEQGEGVLVVAHRKELIVQAKEKIEQISGLEAGIIKAGYPEEPHKDVQVASIQTLSRRKRYPDAGLLIIDEAHHASSDTFTRLIEQYPNAKILGVTATPCRADGQGFKWLFDSLVTGIGSRELIEMGHLSKFKVFAAVPISTKGVKTTGGDFNLSQLEEQAMEVVDEVVPTWQRFSDRKQTLVFCVSIAHSKEVAKLYNEAGYKAEHIDGTTPDKEREAIIERFKNRETMILSNCGIFLEGFDAPGIEAVQCVRPTRSLSLWLQMIGRGLRPSPDKEHCFFIDHSENWRVHGLPDRRREWSLAPVSLTKTDYTQQCPECRHVFQPLSHEQTKPIKKWVDWKGMINSKHISTCPNCRHKFEWDMGSGTPPPGGRQAKKGFGEVIEVNVDTTQEGVDLVQKLVDDQESTGKKKGSIYYQIMKEPGRSEMTLGDWKYLAKVLGYKEGWAYKTMGELRQEQGN